MKVDFKPYLPAQCIYSEYGDMRTFPPKVMSTQNVTLFGNRVFADVIKSG